MAGLARVVAGRGFAMAGLARVVAGEVGEATSPRGTVARRAERD
jgi:hypothetical protein